MPTLLLVLLFVASSSTWSQALPAPRIDDDSYTTYRRISWSDFLDDSDRGRELERRASGSSRSAGPYGRPAQTAVTAWLYSVVQIDEVDISVAPIRDGQSRGRWEARPKRYRVYALMDKKASGVVAARADAETLDHEQGHFDLAELCARRFRAEVGGLRATGRSARSAQEKLVDLLTQRHKDLGRRFRLMQQRYDGETEHAQKPRAQGRWRQRIDRWLRQEVPETCTG